MWRQDGKSKGKCFIKFKDQSAIEKALKLHNA
mgnify:FL=1